MTSQLAGVLTEIRLSGSTTDEMKKQASLAGEMLALHDLEYLEKMKASGVPAEIARQILQCRTTQAE